MDQKFQKLQKLLPNTRIRQNEPMSGHTTFRIGGPAEYYAEVEKTEDLVKIIRAARELRIKFFVLGGGSNILVSDKGVKGLVIKNNCRNFSVMRMSGKVKNLRQRRISPGLKNIDVDYAFLHSESGVIMNQLVRSTIEEGLGGLEYMLGLPGTVGGAIFMNSNFPKKESFVGDVLYSGRILSENGDVKEVEKSYFEFGYDQSILQETKEIVLSVVFKLKPEDKKILWERATEALNYRNKTQPKGLCAGCIFRNISIKDAMSIPTPGRTTSAGYLIDKAKLRGRSVGGAIVSDVHANYIMNKGGATAKDVVDLIKIIKEEVFKKFGVHLTTEVRTIGFESCLAEQDLASREELRVKS